MQVKLNRYIILIAIASLLWAIILALDIVPLLRGGFGWRWPYDAPHVAARLVPLIMALAGFVVGAWWLLKRRGVVALLIWAMIGCVVLTVAGLYVTSDPVYELYTRTVAGAPTGWHYSATKIEDLDATLRAWPDFMRQAENFSSHLRLSPPGLTLAYYSVNHTLENYPAIADGLGRPLRAAQCHNLRLMGITNGELAGAWLGMLMPLWAGLTVLPLYRLGKNVFDERTARWAVIWWPLVPAILIFTPTPNTLFPFGAVLSVALLVEGLRRDRTLWLLAAGVTTSVLTFLSLSALPLVLLMGLYLIGSHWARRRSTQIWEIRSMFRHSFWFGLGLASVWIIFYAIYGVTIISIFEVVFSEHLSLERPYLPWLFLHINDFFMFTGWPLSLLAVVGVWRVGQKLGTRAQPTDGDILTLTVFATLIIFDLSGTLRGETGRILLLLSPFILLVAAHMLRGESRQLETIFGWSLTIVQAVMVLVLLAFLRVVDSGLSEVPATAPIQMTDPQSPAIINSAVFGDVFRLNAFTGHVETHRDSNGVRQSTLVLWLDWESSGQVDVPYFVSLLPVAPDGRVAAAATLVQPFDGAYPTTCWLPESGAIRDQLEVPLFEVAGGDWWLSLSLIDGQTGETLDVITPDGARDHQVGIGPFYPILDR